MDQGRQMPGHAEYEGPIGCLGAGVAGKASRTQLPDCPAVVGEATWRAPITQEAHREQEESKDKSLRNTC